MTAQTYEVAPASFVSSGPTTTNLTQMEGFDANPNAKKTRVRAAGSIDSKAFLLANADPMVAFGS